MATDSDRSIAGSSLAVPLRMLWSSSTAAGLELANGGGSEPRFHLQIRIRAEASPTLF